jgi:hypothetical protein
MYVKHRKNGKPNNVKVFVINKTKEPKEYIQNRVISIMPERGDFINEHYLGTAYIDTKSCNTNK